MTIAASDKIVEKLPWSMYDSMLDILTFGFKKSATHVAILRLQGVIGKVGARGSGMTLDNLNDNIERAFDTPKAAAVLLVINSPGGSPVQSELIAERITQCSNRKGIPVYSFVEDVAASGGYWLACAGSEIYASRSSILGSIGVIHSSMGFHEAIKKLGIERRVYVSGDNKSVLDPFLPTNEDDIHIIQSIQSEIHAAFIDYVKQSRGSKLTQMDHIIFNGNFWCGQTACDYGLIDGIDNVYNFINHRFGEKTKINYIKPAESWIKRKLGIGASSNANFNSNLSEEITNASLDLIRHLSINKY
jgi:signal peptide peptidase SppA